MKPETQIAKAESEIIAIPETVLAEALPAETAPAVPETELEEAVNLAEAGGNIFPQRDGSHIITGTANVREINKALHWELPTDGPKTLSGLILEYLESFPDANAGLTIGRYRLEILELEGNVVRSVRVNLAPH